MEFIDLLENMIVGRAEEEGRNIEDVLDSVIWEFQVREQEGAYRGIGYDLEEDDDECWG